MRETAPAASVCAERRALRVTRRSFSRLSRLARRAASAASIWCCAMLPKEKLPFTARPTQVSLSALAGPEAMEREAPTPIEG
jgi:hypothetical protein